MKQQATIAIVILAVGALCFFAGQYTAPDKTKIEYDTTYLDKKVEIEKIVYKNLPAKLVRDSIFIHDTVRVEVSVAKLDTVLAPYGDTLGVRYFFPPGNFFDLSFAPAPRPVRVEVVTKTVTIYVHDSWVSDVLKIGGGVGLGFVVGSLTKQ